MINIRDQVVATARSQIGVEWHHNQTQLGIALDCRGLVVAVSKACGLLPLDLRLPDYTPAPDGSLIPLCEKYMRRIPREEMQIGDVIVVAVDKEPQHIGILGNYRLGGFSIIHASNAAHPPRVVETRLMFINNFRFVAAFVLPGVA